MAGHGSPPAEDRANHPSRQVGRSTAPIGPLQGPPLPGYSGVRAVTSTQPRPMGKIDKNRPIPLIVQRMRRERMN